MQEWSVVYLPMKGGDNRTSENKLLPLHPLSAHSHTWIVLGLGSDSDSGLGWDLNGISAAACRLSNVMVLLLVLVLASALFQSLFTKLVPAYRACLLRF